MNYYTYDREVIAKIRQTIRDQLVGNFGIDANDLRTARANQPTQQSAGAVAGTKKYQIFVAQIPSNSTIGKGFIDKKVDDVTIERTYHHIKKRVFQLDFLSDYDLTDDDSLEANDLATLTRDMMTQQDTIEIFSGLNIGLIDVSAIRPTFTINQSEQYESSPSFDVTVNYNTIYSRELIAISGVSSSVNVL